MKVQFLIDNKKSWIISFIKNFIIRNKQKYKLSLIHNHNSIKKSDITFIGSHVKTGRRYWGSSNKTDTYLEL